MLEPAIRVEGREAQAPPTPSAGMVISETVAAISAVLSLPDEQLDYARAKLAFDRIIDPSIDAETVLAELDRMAETARNMAGPLANDGAKLAALRKLLYESGTWNEGRPFAYNHEDALGESIPNKLLANYLGNRLGNCVSMPILFLILSERLGLDTALATAPHHIFVHYRAESGHVINLETTSGANPMRDDWVRQNFSMTVRAVKNGIYLRSLPRREAVAHMASTVVEHLADQRRFEEVIAVAKIVLGHCPRDIHALLSLGSAYGQLLDDEFAKKHPMPILIPPPLKSRYLMLVQGNLAAFETAEALGWEPEVSP